MRHPLVISYYTPDTPYEDHAHNLARCLDRFGLRHRIEPRPRRACWVENCAQKAIFVREIHRTAGEPVLWVDADGILLRPLHELNGADVDFAAVRRHGWSFSGGQIYFGTGPRADRLLDDWAHYCQTYPYVWDQVSLGYAWWDAAARETLTTLWMPGEIYQKEHPRPLQRAWQRFWKPPAIMHRQESRRATRQEPARHPLEFRNKQLPKWWREAAAQDRPFPLDAEQRLELGLRLQSAAPDAPQAKTAT